MFPARIGTAHFVPEDSTPRLPRDAAGAVLRAAAGLAAAAGRPLVAALAVALLLLPRSACTALSTDSRSASSSDSTWPCRNAHGPAGNGGRRPRSPVDRPDHSSLGVQHRSAHLSSPCLQQSPVGGWAQNSPRLQHSLPQGLAHGLGHRRPRRADRCTCRARNHSRRSCRPSSRGAGGWRPARGTCRGPISGGRIPPSRGDRMSRACSRTGRPPVSVAGEVLRSQPPPRRARELRESVASASPSRAPARRGTRSDRLLLHSSIVTARVSAGTPEIPSLCRPAHDG